MRKRIRTFKLSQLKDLARTMLLRMAGKKADLIARIEEQIDNGVNYDDKIKLLVIGVIIKKILLHDSIPSYTSLYNAVRFGGANSELMHQLQEDTRTSTLVPTATRAAPASAPRPKLSQNSLPYAGHVIYFRPSPFYSLKHLVLGSPQLVYPSHGRNVTKLQFVLNDQENLVFRSNPGKMQVLLLCGEANPNVPSTPDAHVAFPAPLEIHVNGTHCRDNVKGIKGKPGTARPANITRLVNRTPEVNKIELVYAANTKYYLLYCFIAEAHSSEEIAFEVSQRGHIHLASTVEEIKKEYTNGDDDLVVATSSLSLKCPLTYSRMTMPAKSIYCLHIQCFDCLSFLQLQEQIPTWTCPICSRVIQLADLAVSDYYLEILQNVSKGVELVTLRPDGSWLANDEPSEESSSSPPPNTNVEDEIEVVTIDSESDEEPVAPLVPRSRNVEILGSLPEPLPDREHFVARPEGQQALSQQLTRPVQTQTTHQPTTETSPPQPGVNPPTQTRPSQFQQHTTQTAVQSALNQPILQYAASWHGSVSHVPQAPDPVTVPTEQRQHLSEMNRDTEMPNEVRPGTVGESAQSVRALDASTTQGSSPSQNTSVPSSVPRQEPIAESVELQTPAARQPETVGTDVVSDRSVDRGMSPLNAPEPRARQVVEPENQGGTTPRPSQEANTLESTPLAYIRRLPTRPVTDSSLRGENTNRIAVGTSPDSTDTAAFRDSSAATTDNSTVSTTRHKSTAQIPTSSETPRNTVHRLTLVLKNNSAAEHMLPQTDSNTSTRSDQQQFTTPVVLKIQMERVSAIPPPPRNPPPSTQSSRIPPPPLPPVRSFVQPVSASSGPVLASGQTHSAGQHSGSSRADSGHLFTPELAGSRDTESAAPASAHAAEYSTVYSGTTRTSTVPEQDNDADPDYDLDGDIGSYSGPDPDYDMEESLQSKINSSDSSVAGSLSRMSETDRVAHSNRLVFPVNNVDQVRRRSSSSSNSAQALSYSSKKPKSQAATLDVPGAKPDADSRTRKDGTNLSSSSQGGPHPESGHSAGQKSLARAHSSQNHAHHVDMPQPFPFVSAQQQDGSARAIHVPPAQPTASVFREQASNVRDLEQVATKSHGDYDEKANEDNPKDHSQPGVRGMYLPYTNTWAQRRRSDLRGLNGNGETAGSASPTESSEAVVHPRVSAASGTLPGLASFSFEPFEGGAEGEYHRLPEHRIHGKAPYDPLSLALLSLPPLRNPGDELSQALRHQEEQVTNRRERRQQHTQMQLAFGTNIGLAARTEQGNHHHEVTNHSEGLASPRYTPDYERAREHSTDSIQRELPPAKKARANPSVTPLNALIQDLTFNTPQGSQGWQRRDSEERSPSPHR